MPKVTLRDTGAVFETGRGTILDAALKAGIILPHECRTGSCGTCKCRLVSGLATMDPWESSALSREEAAAGLILACRARAKTDVVVSQLRTVAAHPIRQFAARVVSIDAPTHDVRVVRLEPPSPIAFSAGQYARLTFGEVPPRSYSMANRPSEPVLEFHIRLVPRGVASFHVGSVLQVGDEVQVEAPFGTAHLGDDPDAPILAVAGGTGLAPIRSIVREALAVSPERRIAVYLGVRDECDVYGETEMLGLKHRHPGLTFTAVLSQPSAATERPTGFVHSAVAVDFGDLSGWIVHAAGPPLMVEALKATAMAKHVLPTEIHVDPFTPSTPAKTEGAGLVASLRRRLFG